MIKPTPEQYGLTESLLVSLERERGKFDALEAHIGRLVVLTIAVGAIAALAVYSVYGFDWPLFIPMLLIGAVTVGYLSPLVTTMIVNRLDPHSRMHKLRSEYQIESITYNALWSSAYWGAFWKALSEGGAWKDRHPESPHSRLQCFPDPGEELFILAGERYVLAIPRSSESVNREFANHFLKTVELSSAHQGIICTDGDIPQEVQDVVSSSNITVLPSHLFLAARVLRLAILLVSFPALDSATGPLAPRWHQYCAKLRNSELLFPKPMIREAIAEELKERHDETLQPKLGILYLMLEHVSPDEQAVPYDTLREFGNQVDRRIQTGKPRLDILSPLAHIRTDHTTETNMLETLKKRLEGIEAFEEIAAENVKSDHR
jgi:hypothetical protein